MNMQKFEGPEGIKLLFEKVLDSDEKLLRKALSGNPLVYLAGEDFAEKYMRKRCDIGIFLKSLRFSLLDIDLPQHKDYGSYSKEARIAPTELELKESVIIWDDYVAMVDSLKVSGRLIQDVGYASIMKQWFDFIWSKSS